MATIDINCDMGEAYSIYRCGDDAAIMPFITSANVACGFHASDPGVMHATVRLAKRHGDTRLSHYRDRGVTPGRVLGLLARWMGMDAGAISINQLLEHFRLERLPRQPVVMRPADDDSLYR